MIDLRLGDARDVLATLPAGSARCVITSPPYYGLRDYGTAAWEGGRAGCDHVDPSSWHVPRGNSGGVGNKPLSRGDQSTSAVVHQYRDLCGQCGARRVDRQIGLEASLAEYLAALVAVFAEVKRVLTPDGTLYLNMGDSFGGGKQGGGSVFSNGRTDGTKKGLGLERTLQARECLKLRAETGLGPKQLLGVPWRLAFALQDAGWILRSDIIWAKPNPMPESVRDRPTKAHEYLFLLAKQPRYFWDAEAVREDVTTRPQRRFTPKWVGTRGVPGQSDHAGLVPAREEVDTDYAGRNVRSVWSFPSEPVKLAHFATMPSALAARCVQAGTSERGRCPACSAPWIREVETRRKYVVYEGGSHADGTYHVKYSDEPHDVNFVNRRGEGDGFSMNKTRWHNSTTTTGWRPTCGHDLEPVPDVVLDCFAGAGTTLLVADRLHRDAIGIELNPEYRRMALQRIASDEPLPLFEASGMRASIPTTDGYTQGTFFGGNGSDQP